MSKKAKFLEIMIVVTQSSALSPQSCGVMSL